MIHFIIFSKQFFLYPPKRCNPDSEMGNRSVFFGWYFSAALELGSVNFSLRLQDLQIKRGKNRKKRNICLNFGVVEVCKDMPACSWWSDKQISSTHKINWWVWCMLMHFLGGETLRKPCFPHLGYWSKGLGQTGAVKTLSDTSERSKIHYFCPVQM